MLNPLLPVDQQDPREFWDPWCYMPHQKVRTLRGDIVPWTPWSHLRILAAAQVRAYRESKWIAHLKARREGSTAFFTGVAYQNAAHRRGCTAALIGYKKESALSMAKVASRYWKHEPEAWRPERRQGLKRLLAFDALDSEIVVAAVKDDEPLRGEGVQFALANELSSWEGAKAEDAWVALRSAVPEDGGMLVVDSTGRFAGDPMHNVWKEGAEPGSPWLRIFIPWTMIERYALEPVPGWVPHALVTEYRKSHVITDAQAYWMHKVGLPKTQYKLGKFMAEYPYDDHEPFQVSGESIFDEMVLVDRRRLLDQGTHLIDEFSEYEEFKAPDPQHHYVIAVDPASSWSERDHFGVQVIDVTAFEQVAEFQGHKTSFSMARFLIELSTRYNRANIYVEANGVGEGVLSHLVDSFGWPHVFFRRDLGSARPKPGWWSNAAHKAQAIGTAQEIIDDGSLILYSTRTIDQLLGYRDGKWASHRDAQSGHFDLAIAMFIGCWAAMAELNRTNRVRKSRDAIAAEAIERFIERLDNLTPGLAGTAALTPWGAHR